MSLQVWKNIDRYDGFEWLIIMGSGMDYWIYLHFFTININYNSSNQWLRTLHYILDECPLFHRDECRTKSPLWMNWMQNEDSPTDKLRWAFSRDLPLERRENRIQTTTSNSQLSFSVVLCHGNMLTESLPSKWSSASVRCYFHFQVLFTTLLLSNRLFQLSVKKTCVSWSLDINGLFRLPGVSDVKQVIITLDN